MQYFEPRNDLEKLICCAFAFDHDIWRETHPAKAHHTNQMTLGEIKDACEVQGDRYTKPWRDALTYLTGCRNPFLTTFTRDDGSVVKGRLWPMPFGFEFYRPEDDDGFLAAMGPGSFPNETGFPNEPCRYYQWGSHQDHPAAVHDHLGIRRLEVTPYREAGAVGAPKDVLSLGQRSSRYPS